MIVICGNINYAQNGQILYRVPRNAEPIYLVCDSYVYVAAD